MKKVVFVLWAALAVAIIGANSSFAQQKEETPQEQIVRLQLEKQILEKQIEILKIQLQQLKADSLNQQKVAEPILKPYYADDKIQQRCESWPPCQEAAGQYWQQDSSFQITKAKFSEWDALGYLHQQLTIEYNTQNGHKKYTFMRIAAQFGENPTRWEYRSKGTMEK